MASKQTSKEEEDRWFPRKKRVRDDDHDNHNKEVKKTTKHDNGAEAGGALSRGTELIVKKHMTVGGRPPSSNRPKNGPEDSENKDKNDPTNPQGLAEAASRREKEEQVSNNDRSGEEAQKSSMATAPSVFIWGSSWYFDDSDKLCVRGKEGIVVDKTPSLIQGLDDIQQLAFNSSISFAISDGTVEKVLWRPGKKTQNANQTILEGQKFHSVVTASGLNPDPTFAGILRDGSLVTWGGNLCCALGRYIRKTPPFDYYAPEKVLLPNTSVRLAACGDGHTMALTWNGYVFSWGLNPCTGHDGSKEKYQITPKRIDPLEDIGHIATYSNHSAAVTNSGDVYTWGRRDPDDSRLNAEVTDEEDFETRLSHDTCLPAKIRHLSSEHVVYASCGQDHTAVITKEGCVYTWGYNASGQLGNGNTMETNQCIRVRGPLENETVKKVVCGVYTTFALTDHGEVFSWGDCHSRTLGHDSDEATVTVPKRIEGLAPFVVTDLVLTFGTASACLAHPRQHDYSPRGQVPTFNGKESLPDVTYWVEGQEIHAHQDVLAQQCDYFKAMFSTGMKESVDLSSSSERRHVIIEDVGYETFLKIVEYLYTGKIEISADDLMEMYRVADMYNLPKLCDRCCTLLERQYLTEENAAAFLQQSDAFNFEALRRICLDFVRAHFREISNTDGTLLSGIRPGLLWEIVKGKSLA